MVSIAVDISYSRCLLRKQGSSSKQTEVFAISEWNGKRAVAARFASTGSAQLARRIGDLYVALTTVRLYSCQNKFFATTGRAHTYCRGHSVERRQCRCSRATQKAGFEFTLGEWARARLHDQAGCLQVVRDTHLAAEVVRRAQDGEAVGG